jgi:hypothetical protein
LLGVHRIFDRPNVRYSGLQHHFFLNHVARLHPVVTVLPYVQAVEFLDIRIPRERNDEIHHLVDSRVDLTGEEGKLLDIRLLQLLAYYVEGGSIRIRKQDDDRDEQNDDQAVHFGEQTKAGTYSSLD